MTDAPGQAEAMFRSGYNCAQSVLACCGQRYGLDRQTAIRVAQGLGGGMCHLGEACGAVLGAFMVVGLKHAKSHPQDDAAKQAAHELVNEVARRLRALHGSIKCTDLLGVDLGTAQGLQQARDKGLFRTLCPVFVRDAAKIVEEVLGQST